MAGANTLTVSQALTVAGSVTNTGTMQNQLSPTYPRQQVSIVNVAGAIWNLANGAALVGGGSFTNSGVLSNSASAPLGQSGRRFCQLRHGERRRWNTSDFVGPLNSFAGTVSGSGALALGSSTTVSTTTLAASLQIDRG